MSGEEEVPAIDVEAPAGEATEPALPDTYTLRHPVQFGEETIESLTLKPNGRAMQGFSMKFAEESIVFEPYKFAELGLKLAGKPRAIIDRMHPADQSGLGMLAMGFIVPGLGTGKTPSR